MKHVTLFRQFFNSLLLITILQTLTLFTSHYNVYYHYCHILSTPNQAQCFYAQLLISHRVVRFGGFQSLNSAAYLWSFSTLMFSQIATPLTGYLTPMIDSLVLFSFSESFYRVFCTLLMKTIMITSFVLEITKIKLTGLLNWKKPLTDNISPLQFIQGCWASSKQWLHQAPM